MKQMNVTNDDLQVIRDALIKLLSSTTQTAQREEHIAVLYGYATMLQERKERKRSANLS